MPAISMRTFSYTNKTTFFMKHLKKLFTLLILLTLIFGSWTLASEYPTSSPSTTLESTPTGQTITHTVEPAATHIIFQSKDGGQTWQDISQGLPENVQPDDFFAGESDIYLRVKSGMYRSKSNLETPVWERDNALNPRSASIAFNRSGAMAYNHKGPIYQKMAGTGTWLPIYKNSAKLWVRSIFETSDGTVFLGSDTGLYKSEDKGQSWKQVLQEGWVMELVESEGVLIGTGQKGIMRSTDKGEHWEWVISEGGVGIAVERIDGGFAAIAYNTRTQSRKIYISLNRGETWKAIDEGLPPSSSISSIKQMGKYLVCGHPDGIFRSSDMGNTWTVVHPGVDNTVKIFRLTANSNSGTNKKVFKLFVSGNVLYAVARNFGC